MRVIEKVLLEPNPKESEKDYLARFMDDEQSVSEFPDKKQRYAVGYRVWESQQEKVEKRLALWGSTAGKTRLAKRVVPMIPEHETYVEPFAGGAAIFYAKPKEMSKREVLADTNSEVAFSFKFIRDLNDDDAKKVRSKNWIVSRETAKRVHEMTPSSGPERFYRFAYKRYSLFMGHDNRITAIDPSKEGRSPTLINNLERTKERLRGVKVHNDSYEKVVKAYDSASTFYYLDPPYPRCDQNVGEKEFDEPAFIKCLQKLKGKFLLHYDARDKKKFLNKGWNVKVITATQTLVIAGKKPAAMAGKLLEVTNYAVAKKCEAVDFPDLYESQDAPLEKGTVGSLAGKLLEVTNYTPTEKAESYAPPKEVQTEAAKGLELRRTWERGGLDVSEASEEGIGSGVQRATNLKNGDNISLSTIKRMSNFFSRHQANYRPDKKMPDGGPTAGTIAWLLWGGDPGKAWAATILQAQEKSVSDVSWTMPIIKKDDDEKIVTGVVLEPDEVDAQGDTVTAKAIGEAAYKFLSKFNKDTEIGFMHKAFGDLGVSLIESWIAREDGEMGGNAVKKGSWLMSVKIDRNDKLWEKVKSGKISGFSIGGVARVSR